MHMVKEPTKKNSCKTSSGQGNFILQVACFPKDPVEAAAEVRPLTVRSKYTNLQNLALWLEWNDLIRELEPELRRVPV